MMDLLVAVILASCPIPDGVKTTECQEKIWNCAVKDNGSIDAASIKRCTQNEMVLP